MDGRGIDGFRMDVITLISKHLDSHGRCLERSTRNYPKER